MQYFVFTPTHGFLLLFLLIPMLFQASNAVIHVYSEHAILLLLPTNLYFFQGATVVLECSIRPLSLFVTEGSLQFAIIKARIG